VLLICSKICHFKT